MPPRVKMRTEPCAQASPGSTKAKDSEGSKARATATRLKNKETEEQANLKLQSEAKAPRGAKVAALKNAIWLNGKNGGDQGTTPRKRGRQPSTPAKSRKRTRKEPDPSQSDDFELVDHAELVDIPVPAAPKKPRGAARAMPGMKIAHDIKSIKPFAGTILESQSDSSVTESETESETPDELDDDGGNNDSAANGSDDENEGNNPGNTMVLSMGKSRVARKQQLDEQPRWTEQPSENSRAPNHVIVRNRIVEISDDESSVGTSPTPQAGSGLNTVAPLDGSDSEPSEDDDNDYPDFTALVHIPGRELTLGHQHFELKLVVRKAMYLVVERLIFENGFPSLATRAVWNRRCLIKACSSIEQSTGSHARGRYSRLLERLKTDAEYVKELSKLLDARVPITRGNLKTIAVTHAMSAYDLAHANGDRVVDLLRDMKYIYPVTSNGNGVIGSKPYQHKAIIDVLRDFLFGPHSTVSTVTRNYFDPTLEHTNRFPPSTIALAATAVCAAIDEWRTGSRLPVLFTSNIYTDIYNNHVVLLKSIMQRNDTAYTHLLRQLYLSASGDTPATENTSIYLDTQNMPTG